MRNAKGQFIKGRKLPKGHPFSIKGKIPWNKNLKTGLIPKSAFKQGHQPIAPFKKGHIPWNKDIKGVCKMNSGSFKKGNKPHNKGKKCPEFSGVNHPMYGKHHSEESKKKMSEKLKGKFKGKNNPMYGKKGKESPNWQGGISFEPYGQEFDDELKEQIRKRDNYTCQECGYTQKQLGYKLHPHHIDYDKQNNDPNNLISLCRSCHAQTNFGREDWTNYFINLTNF